MKNSRHRMPQINAGSMADIAFLLLIFFLVTAVIPQDDVGFFRTLPKPCPPGETCESQINERNIFEIRINGNNELFVENEIIQLEDLKSMTKAFLDNNGDKSCLYCNGSQLASSSDNPNEAVVSLKNSRFTSYEFYINVQDELTKAYYELRSTYALNRFNKTEDKLSKNEMAKVKEAYPFILSEAELD